MNYLDTSLLTAYYCREPRSARVQRILSRIEGPTISPLVEVEFYSTVARKVRVRDLDAIEARRIFSQFQLHLAEPRYHIVPIHDTDYRVAKDWIGQLACPLRVLDAIHLALAFAYDLCLQTADRDLARSAKHFGVKHRLID
jgi:predicted nucleic acid-binding protein